MAVGDPYCTVGELREYCQIPDTVDDLHVDRVCRAVSRQINFWTHRQFNDAGVASARVFYPDNRYYTYVDDFHTTTGLIVRTDSGGSGVYDTTIDTGGFTLSPLGGAINGVPEPYRRIQLHDGFYFPSYTRAPLEVTARWGWATVPEDVKLASLILGAEKFRRRYSPSGLQTVGSGDFQFTAFVSRFMDPDASELLEPYRLRHLLVA